MRRKTISKETKKAVWEKCGGRCWYCGKHIVRPLFHFDHVYPHSKGGKDSVENLAVSCIQCNLSKRNFELWRWRVRIQKRLGLTMSRTQLALLRSESIDPLDNPYSWETPVLFFFERNTPKEKLFGIHDVLNYIRFKGWQE